MRDRIFRFGMRVVAWHGIGVILILIALAGCEWRASDSGERATRPVPHVTGLRDKAPEIASVSRPLPTPAQRDAIETIRASGGSVSTDPRGLPVLIDVARDRVFADESIVLAVLEFPDLQRLRLAVSTVTPETIGRLKSLTQLREFLLQDAGMEDATLRKLLHGMPHLQRLTLRRLSRITDEGVEAVVHAPELEVLALIEMNGVTRSFLSHLPQIRHLRSLDLRNCGRLSSADIATLGNLDGLEDLKLGGPMANDEVVTALEGLPAVCSLTMEDSDISAGGLQRLAASTKIAQRLKRLSFARCSSLDDNALVVLGQFPNLDSIALRDIMVTGSFLGTLHASGVGPRSWKSLAAAQCFLNDESVQSLPEVAPQLVHLDLRKNYGITDASLEWFQRLRSLESLNLEETGVTHPPALPLR